MKQQLKIDGVPIKTPTEFSISRFNLTKSGRLTSGKMVMDLIAKKRKFTLAYEVLSSTQMNTILNLIDSDKMFFTLEYIENNVVKTATVYVGEIPSSLFRTGNVWYWKGVSFSLIEQ